MDNDAKSAVLLSNLLQRAFRQQAAEVARLLSPGVLTSDQDLDLSKLGYWPERLAEVVRPIVGQLYRRGIVESRRRLAAFSGAPVLRWPQRIAIPADRTFGQRVKQLGASFDLFDPMVSRAIDKATLQFCEETNSIATMDLRKAVDKLRGLLKRGLERGKAVAQLAREVGRIFASPNRAYAIAATESSRAIHSGALLNAKESSLKLRKEWLASSNACGRCSELNGVEKELDEPFVVDGTGPYAVVMTPPLHPHCFCTWTEVLV